MLDSHPALIGERLGFRKISFIKVNIMSSLGGGMRGLFAT